MTREPNYQGMGRAMAYQAQREWQEKQRRGYILRQPPAAFLDKAWRLAAMVAARQGYAFCLWERPVTP